MQILDIFLKVVWRLNTDRYKYYVIGIIFLCPLISIIGLLSFQTVGYTKGWAFCFTVEHNRNTDWYFYFSVSVIVQGFGFCLFLAVLFKALFWLRYSKRNKIERAIDDDVDVEENNRIVNDEHDNLELVLPQSEHEVNVNTNNNDTVEGTNTNKVANVNGGNSSGGSFTRSLSLRIQTSEYLNRIMVLRAPILFAFVYTINVCSIISLHVLSSLHLNADNALFDNWTNCMFENFYTNYDLQFPNDYYNEAARNEFAHVVCGDAAGDGNNAVLETIVGLSIFACSIYISLIFCKPELCCSLCFCNNKKNKVYSSTYDSNQSFVTMHVDEIKEYNQPSAYYNGDEEEA